MESTSQQIERGWVGLGTPSSSSPHFFGPIDMTQVETIGSEGFQGGGIEKCLKDQGHLK